MADLWFRIFEPSLSYTAGGRTKDSELNGAEKNIRTYDRGSNRMKKLT
jgi:hypothetical protein